MPTKVKLQIKIDYTIYQGLKGICGINRWNMTTQVEHALDSFLVRNGMKWHNVLKRYVLDVPNVQSINTVIRKVKDNASKEDYIPIQRSKTSTEATTKEGSKTKKSTSRT